MKKNCWRISRVLEDRQFVSPSLAETRELVLRHQPATELSGAQAQTVGKKQLAQPTSENDANSGIVATLFQRQLCVQQFIKPTTYQCKANHASIEPVFSQQLGSGQNRILHNAKEFKPLRHMPFPRR